MTGRDLVTDAFYEVNILGAGEVLTPEDLAFGLGKLNRILDSWNAKHEAAYCDVFSTFTLTPALSPHTIGPAGTFVVTQRPVSIEGISLIVSGTKTPIWIRDQAWYRSLSVPTLTGATPTDCFYEKDWPAGKLFFYPVPTAASQVELQIRTLLTAFTENTVFALPPGYQDALTLTLAESLSSGYPGAVVTGKLSLDATAARALIFGNNTTIPRLMTRDAGMPSRAGQTFDYRTGPYR